MQDYAHADNSAPITTQIRPVSGRYEGDMSLPQPGRLFLDLRIDVDAATPHSLTVNRVSGDLYQLVRSNLPGQPPRVSRTYIESWIVDHPETEWAPDHAIIKGVVRFWTGTHAATTMETRIEWDPIRQSRSALASFTEVDGSRRTFACHKAADYFRKLSLEVDVCMSVDMPPLIPSYETSWHQDHPPDLKHRTLTIEQAYREAGVDITIEPVHTRIDDSDPSFSSWSPAELHDAMETHFSLYAGTWPNWAMWGLLAGEFEKPGVGGIMFDAAALLGGAGKAPERQGFAVFRNHKWFEHLPAEQPQNQEQAWALRHFLYTWVHEAGHAFNFLHSWNKGRPDALSWMNYDWRYEQRNGPDTFWKHFAFAFDNDELIHLRHGNRAAVIMGGDPWSSGSHLEAPNLAMTQLEGDSPLELIVRSKGYFEFMETVIVELRLRNTTNDTPVAIDSLLAPEYGTVAILVQKPDGSIVGYDPVICALANPLMQMLQPGGGSGGSDRFSKEVFLTYGANGFLFDRPGEYRIRAVYQGPGDVLVPSDTHRLRVGSPVSNEANRLAQDYFEDGVGLTLYLKGSRSPHLEKYFDFLRDFADRYRDTTMGANIALSLADGLSRPFHRIAGDAQADVKEVKQVIAPDPRAALDMTKPALELFQKAPDKDLNLAYGRTVRRRKGYFDQLGEAKQARPEIAKLCADLSKRGAHADVVAQYAQLSAEAAPTATIKRTAAASSPSKPKAKASKAQKTAKSNPRRKKAAKKAPR